METNRFPSIFPIRIPTRSGRRTPAGRADFGKLSCSPALRHLLLAATTHTTPCAGKLLILLKKAKYFRDKSGDALIVFSGAEYTQQGERSSLALCL